jgi:hypothetical protein
VPHAVTATAKAVLNAEVPGSMCDITERCLVKGVRGRTDLGIGYTYRIKYRDLG